MSLETFWPVNSVKSSPAATSGGLNQLTFQRQTSFHFISFHFIYSLHLHHQGSDTVGYLAYPDYISASGQGSW